MDQITITREACCAADDQSMPLQLVLSVSPGETIGSLLQRVIGEHFLQFSSTRASATCFVGAEPIARVIANFNALPTAEFIIPAELPLATIAPDGLLEFSWSGPNYSLKRTDQSLRD